VPHRVILLPGIVVLAAITFTRLLEALGDRVDAVAKELEVHAAGGPPDIYGLDTEAAGIGRAADEAGFERFHLVGYSGGGAAGLVYAAAHPERLLSLALLEAAWAGNERSPREAVLHERFRLVDRLPADALMTEFARLQLAPGVEPAPPPDPPPAWLASRPAAIRTFVRSFDATHLDLDALRRFRAPVYYGLGGLSNPDYFEAMAERLAGVFSDFTVEVFPERHHFDPPHRAEADALARSLIALWERGSPAPGRSPAHGS
jgi:pimeloyl-ACP methyl ester carboxylesterase